MISKAEKRLAVKQGLSEQEEEQTEAEPPDGSVC